MPSPSSPTAFQRVQALLDKALESTAGIFYPCSEALAIRLEAEIRTVRKISRKESTKIYPTTAKQYNRSVYDRVITEVTPRGLALHTQITKNTRPNPHHAMTTALDSGTFSIQFASRNAAKNFRRQCYLIRGAERKSKDSIATPMENRSIYDKLTFRLSEDNILTLEAGLWNPESIIDLDSVDFNLPANLPENSGPEPTFFVEDNPKTRITSSQIKAHSEAQTQSQSQPKTQIKKPPEKASSETLPENLPDESQEALDKILAGFEPDADEWADEEDIGIELPGDDD